MSPGGPEAVDRVRRREYPDPDPGIFLNAASWGLVPRSAAAEAADLTLRRNRSGGFREEELGRALRRCREAVAALLRVEPEEIVLAPNTSFGVNLAAALVAAGPPGVVVTSHGEFPANVLPWRALEPRGFTVDLVPTRDGYPDEEALLERLDAPGVRALALSAVQFVTGYRADLARFGRACRERGVLFCVDAIQALGAVPLHPGELDVDVLASGGQKWLCAPWGSGFAWVRRGLLERVTPPMVSWLGLKDATRFDDLLHYRMDFLPDGRRFELATLGIQDYLGLARSLELFLEMGVEAVRDHIRHVQAPLLEWVAEAPGVRLVSPRDPERRAGIVSFVPPDAEDVARRLAEADVVFALREGCVRFAPHFYNTVDEMEEVVAILRRGG